ncbi:MAG: hypothetical protein AAB658_09300 [Chloroflexota bacterium]
MGGEAGVGVRPMNWLEISLTLDPELAESVADVLAPSPIRASPLSPLRSLPTPKTRATRSALCACALTCLPTT